MSVPPPTVRLACRSMNTRFELVLWGRDEDYLTAVGEEAIEEIHRLNQQLSFYRDDSDIRELNVFAARRPVTVEPRLFRLLQRAKALSEATEGAFDITIAPLLQAWGFTGGGGRVPTEDELAAARELTGIHLVELDPENFTVRFLREGVMLDLGAIGKGYAIERVAGLIAEHELPGALVHGGTSTVCALGTQPDGSPWNVAIKDPTDAHDPEMDDPEADPSVGSRGLFAMPLRDQSLSVSALHGKWFEAGEVRFGHVLDPRSGRPVQGALLAAVSCGSATDSDALSTALLTQGSAFLERLKAIHEDARALVVVPEGESIRVECLGFDL